MSIVWPSLNPGRYVVAVSGGVDSVALLHMLVSLPGLQLTVAHFDHGIREDSGEDRRLVQELADSYGLPFVSGKGNLSANASEATARKARYDFLRSARSDAGAEAIITAHHQDDLLETAVLNMLRGTGRRGLSSLMNTTEIRRPLLALPKADILRYATGHDLRWREDSTNADVRYLRNYVRARIVPRLGETGRRSLLAYIATATKLNGAIGSELDEYLGQQPGPDTIYRDDFIMLPHAVAREVMGQWLLRQTGVELSRTLLERLVIAGKTGRLGSRVDVDKNHWLQIRPGNLALVPRER